jgi:hypothetical protein
MCETQWTDIARRELVRGSDEGIAARTKRSSAFTSVAVLLSEHCNNQHLLLSLQRRWRANEQTGARVIERERTPG